MSAYLGTEPIFVLEGQDGRCELWADELGYSLYVEWPESYKPDLFRQYASRNGAVSDAFEDAKNILLLDEWRMDWESVELNMELDDLQEWDDFKGACEDALTGDN